MAQIPYRIRFKRKDKESKDTEFEIILSFDKMYDDWIQNVMLAYQQAKQYLQRSCGPDFDRIVRIGPESL